MSLHCSWDHCGVPLALPSQYTPVGPPWSFVTAIVPVAICEFEICP